MATELEQKIIKQIEYYFGDINLPRDKFLQEKSKEDDGWIPLKTLLTFKRLAALSEDPDIIANAVDKSENVIVVVSEDRTKLRRNPENPIPELNDERKKQLMERTAYVKGFPLDEDLNDIISFLEPYGPIDSCSRRATKDHKFKGSCFVIFKDTETCKKFLDLESVKYKNTELIKKLQSVYFADKKAEFEKRKQAQKEKKQKLEDNLKAERKPIEFPKGSVLYFSGLEEGQTLTREEIKEKVKEVGGIEVQFIDFNKGDLKGYVRFPEENNAIEVFKKITDGEMEVEKFKLKFKILEGEEEDEYLKKSSDAILDMRQKNKLQGRNNRKRKGNFKNNQHRDGKSKRTRKDD